MQYHAHIGTSLGTVVFRSDGDHLTGLYFAGQKDCPFLPGLAPVHAERHGPSAGFMGGQPIKSIRVASAQNSLALFDEVPAPGSEAPDAIVAAPLISLTGRLEASQEATPPAVLELFKVAVDELEAYFMGTRRVFDLPIRLEGTVFQVDVWNALLTIPYGEYVSYREVAASAGRSLKHVRAVGSAVGRNPVSIVVPCHRVLSSTGALHGYTGGLDRKYTLLQLEGLLAREL